MATAATTIDASTASRLLSSTAGLPGGKAAMPLVAKQVELIRKEREALDALASDTASEEERLNALLVKRHALQQNMADAEKHNNKELTEHYKAASEALRQQIEFVKKTNKMERERISTVKRHETELGRVNLRLKAGRTVDSARLTRLGDQEKVLQQQSKAVLARTLAERQGLKTGEDLSDIHKSISAELEKQGESNFASKLNEKLSSVRDNAGKLGFEMDGLTKTQSLMVHGFGKIAEFASFGVAMGFAKKALVGFAEAADSVTEAQYHSGVSFDKLDHSVKHYAKNAVDVAELNTNLGLSLTNMGLDADEAKDIVPKMLSKNGVALQEFMRGNTGALQKMGKQAGAYARQSNQSMDDALDFQNQLMSSQGMSADQASDAMNTIVGSFKGMNDYMQDHGFKGALLNVTALAKATQEAAASAKTASFNTKTYSETMSKAAGTARMFGMSEKSATEAGARYAEAANNNSGFMKLKRGTATGKYLQSHYGAYAQRGDIKGLKQELMAKEGLAEENAEAVASMLIAKSHGKGGANWEARLASQTAGSQMNQNVYNNLISSYLAGRHIDPNDPQALNTLMQDPNLAIWLGMDVGDLTDPDNVKLIQVAWHQYQQAHGVQAPHATPPKPGKTPEQEQKEAMEKAAREANAANTAQGKMFSWQNLKNQASVMLHNPFVDTALVAGALGVRSAVKRSGGLGKILGKFPGIGKLFGGGTAKAAEAGASATGKELAEFGGKEVVEDAAKAAAKTTAKGAEKAVAETGVKALAKTPGMRKISTVLLKGLMKTKYGKLAGAVGLGVAGFGAYKIYSHNAEDVKDLNTAAQAASGTPPIDANQATAPAPNTARFTPDTVTDATTSGIGAAALGMGANVASFGAKKLFGKGAAEAAEAGGKTVAKKGLGKVLGKTISIGAREIPLLGSLISGGITMATTEGPLGRKIMAGIGDAAGTLGGQALTGGLGGAVAGTAMGAAGSFGMEKLYDSIFGSSPSTAVPAVARAAQSTPGFNVADAMSAVTGAPPMAPTGMGGPRIAGIGSFSTMRPDGTVVLTVPVAGFPQAVQQATNFNQAMTTQYSGKRT